MRRLLALLLLAAAVLVLPAAGRADPPPTPVVYLAGDSVLAETYLPATATFAARLTARLGYPVHNVAVGGQRCWVGSNSLEAQWPSIVNASPPPTTIVVHIETNDVGVPGVTNQQLVDCWNFLYFDPVYGAVARGIRIIPMLIVPTAPSRTDMKQQHDFVDAWLPAFLGASAVADTVTPLAGQGQEWTQPTMCWDYGSTGVHPSWLGVEGMVAYFPIQLIQ